MSNFKFETSCIFGISGRGLVFRGNVIEGKLVTGETVTFLSGGSKYLATVSVIESERKVVDETINNKEIGLLLTRFDVKEINDLYRNMSDIDEVKHRRSPEEVLGAEYPLILLSSDSI